MSPTRRRHLAGWGRAAGFSEVVVSASAWSFATADEREWWGELWAERLTESRFAEQAVDQQLATPADLGRLAEGWRRWLAEPDAAFFVLHGELLCTP